jgi:hypothetical protein
MEDLILLNELRWEASDNMDYMQTLHKFQSNHERKLKGFLKGDLVLWMPTDEKIKRRKFCMPWEGLSQP